ncbi:MAG: 30S ribosomal protein S1 [Acidobacteriota bacterium]|nr:30S ribosomal protein S1 [Acidobacteriota bacterium]
MANHNSLGRDSETRDLEAPTPSETETSFGDILSQYEQSHATRASGGAEGREATVVAVSGESVFLDVGLKTEGIMPVEGFRDPAGNLTVKAGDKMHAAITGRDPEGYYQLSLIKVARPKDWSSLEQAFAEKRAIAGVVSGLIKGGVTVDVGVRAFMPGSRSGTKDAAELQALVGQEISCRIIKLDVADEDVVVDRRVVLEEEEKHSREQRLTDLREGMVVRGTVRSLMDYGAFVDIGGIDGMLHVGEISWGRIGKPADVLTVGQQVDVQILKVDPNKRRVALGMKQLQPDPWTQVGEKFHAGDRVKGTVSRVTDFGAFVELEPGLDGLVHLSEMSWSKKVRKPGDVVKPGDMVEVVVLGVHAAEHRISLGLKQTLGDPWAEAEKQYPPGTIVEGPVTSLTKFGAFVQLGEDVEGMIHVGDISAEKRIEHPQDVLKAGQQVRAIVLEMDRGKRRLRLGLKQLQPTSVDEYIAEHKEGDMVTGRVADVSRGKVTVELGEGVRASCNISGENREEKQSSEGKTDVSALSSMLANKWKKGQSEASGPVRKESARAGQVRSFRISRLDAEKKRIELELAS